MTTERTRRLAAVWFADIVGYTELSSRDEDGALAVVDELQRLAREEVESHGGRIVKFQGDAVLTVFDSTDAALRAALALQESFSASEIVQEKGCALRIGVHVGEIVEAEDGDVYGDGVNLASRIEGVASAGQIVVSEDVYRQVRQRGEHQLYPVGMVNVKGIAEPLKLYGFDEGTSLVSGPPTVRQTRTAESEFLAFQEALVGRYSLQREIGRGGMGVVYLAHEVRLDRPVALKLLPAQFAAQPVLRDRFLQEARTAAKLSHPNIVPVHAVDEVDDFVFFAMAFVEGESLGERIRERGPLRPAEAARILREVAWALSYAHLQGVVHRDIKPDNILLEAAGGRALVTDFGIAVVGESQGLGSVTEILGTAEFMSPEQASGEDVDGRSDLYSLGIVGHYMLSGELPFQGSTVAATLAKQLTQEAPALATVAPDVPKNLSEAMVRCLAKDPEERFQGGEELADALTSSLAIRREVPVAIRVFAEQNRESSVAIGGTSLMAAAGLITLAVVFPIQGPPPQVWAFMTLVALGLAATPPLILTHIARRLLRSGYGYDELVQALGSDVEERRQDLAAEYGDPTGIDRWAPRIAGGSVALVVGGLVWGALGPILGGVLGDTLMMLWGAAWVTGAAAGLTATVRHQIKSAVPGEGWFKFWKGPLGRGIFKLSKFRLGSVAKTGASYGHTEMAIGMAADRLFDGLPRDVQKSFSELPDVVRTLEQDADGMRSRIKELDALLAQIEGDEALGKSERVAASPAVADRQDSLADDLRNARDAADARLSEVVVALETIRLELLRMHAGAGSVEGMTADLSSARDLSQDIGRVLEGAREVEKLLDSPSSSA